MQNLHAIILTNQLKAIWPSSLGVPSNAVNILYKNNYICYFLKLPKLLSQICFFLKSNTFLCNVSLYRQCLFSAYNRSKRLFNLRSVSHFFSIFSLSFLLNFLFVSLGGVISINFEYKWRDLALQKFL